MGVSGRGVRSRQSRTRGRQAIGTWKFTPQTGHAHVVPTIRTSLSVFTSMMASAPTNTMHPESVCIVSSQPQYKEPSDDRNTEHGL